MNMHTVGQSGNLSAQELATYFAWPPQQEQSRETNACLVVLLIVVVVFIVVPVGSMMLISLASQQNGYLYLFFLIGLLISAFFVYREMKRRYKAARPVPRVPDDQEYEDWVRSWRNAIRQYGLQKLGLSNSDVVGKPLYVRSIVWPNSHDAKFYRSFNAPLIIKYGLDGRAHASVNRYTFFYPTQHYIAVFTGDINALGQMRFEGTRTYFYDDIVGVETSAMTFNDEYTTYAMQHFELRVSSGQSIGATTYVHDLDVDQTVQALRTLLRDKKYGIRGGNYGLNP